MNINKVSELNYIKVLSINKIYDLDLPYQTQSFKGFLKNADGFLEPKVNTAQCISLLLYT